MEEKEERIMLNKRWKTEAGSEGGIRVEETSNEHGFGDLGTRDDLSRDGGREVEVIGEAKH